MMRTLRLVAVVVAMLAGAAGSSVVSVPTSAAIDHSKGIPGPCPDDDGVTVVIDFQELGGDVIVRCAPGPVEPGFTGLDALGDAGFQIEGVRRWGEAFICRIEGTPGPGESIPIDGNEGYQEACIDTPPASAYWSYWHAPNGGNWEYSQWGVKNRDAIPGGFEGWSFSLNATAETNPQPRFDPIRPGTEDEPPPTRGAEPTPETTDPNERAPHRVDDEDGAAGSGTSESGNGSGGNSGSGSGPASGNEGAPGQHPEQGTAGQGYDSTTSPPEQNSGDGGDPADAGPLPPPIPRSSVTPTPTPTSSVAPDGGAGDDVTPDDDATVAWSGGEHLSDQESGTQGSSWLGVPMSAWLVLAIMIGLGLAAWFTVRRRRQAWPT